MVGVLQITFTAFYPWKQHSAVWQNLCYPLLDYMTEVVFISPLPLWRLLADGPLTRFPHLGYGGRGGEKWGSRDPKEDGMDSEGWKSNVFKL